jgi:hypothetical protein|tara:strand:- start:397 stop:855 length:459 start_codon:yes stop_codon:yes gene_type:complete
MRKLWKTGEVVSNILKIRCLICDEVKNEEDFHEKGNSYLGKDRRCKTCKIEVSKQWHLDNPGHHLKKYNITLEDFDNMLKKQGGTCANEACTYGLDDDHKLFVDHCHTTNVVRGLLCHWCNSAEGFLKSSPEVAQGLIDYMKKHNLKTNKGS